MRHSVHLFFGSRFEQIAKDLKSYILKYQETNASQYFHAYWWQSMDKGGVKIHEIVQNDIDVSQFVSTLDEEFSVTLQEKFCEEKSLSDDQIRYFFEKCYAETITISNTGDYSELLLTMYLPLVEEECWQTISRITKLLADIDKTYTVDVVGISFGLLDVLFENKDNAQKYTEHRNLCQNLIKTVVETKPSLSRMAHFVLLQNTNQAGIAVINDRDSFIRLIGEYALTGISHYHEALFLPNFENEETPITGIGLSVLNLDKYYFVHYLLRKAYLHILARENVSLDHIDVSSIEHIAQDALKQHNNLMSAFWEESVKPFIQQQKSEKEIVAALASAIDKKINAVEKDLQNFVSDGELALPTKQAILAMLLGEDDPLHWGTQYSEKLLTVDDLSEEAANVFISKEDFKTVVDPDDKCEDVSLPSDEIKKLRTQIRRSIDYIRRQTESLEMLEGESQAEYESHGQLTEEGYKYKGVTYKLLPAIEEHPLTETYEPHKVSEKSVDLRKYFTVAKNQGQIGACSVFSIVSLVEYILKKSKTCEADLSEAFVYYNIREAEGKTGEDTGSSLYEVIDSIAKLGVCEESLCVYSPTALLTTRPSDDAYENAKEKLIKTAKNVDVSIDAIRSALSDEYPVCISLKVFDSFGSDTSGFIKRPTDEEIANQKPGNHAMVICGYSDINKVFIVRNSWGKEFGEKGYCYIPYSYIEQFCNSACIVTQLSTAEIKIKGGGKESVSFNDADVSIKRAIIQNLISEERLALKKSKQKYSNVRSQYVQIMQQLSNASVRQEVYDLTDQRIKNEIANLEEEHRKIINEEMPEAVRNFNARTWYIGKILIGSVVGVLSLLWLLWYWDLLQFSLFENYPWYAVLVTLAMVGIACLYFPYRNAHLKDLKRRFKEKAEKINMKIANLQKELETMKLKMHIAGMIIDRMGKVQNNLQLKYKAMVSYVNNLALWDKEEQEKIEQMDALVKEPFIPLLSNSKLDSFFESKKENITESVKLWKQYDKFSLGKDNIIAFKQNLKKSLVSSLWSFLDDFNMYSHISGKTYPYLDSAYTDVKKILPEMDKKSDIFVHLAKDIKLTPAARYLILNTLTTNDMNMWQQQSTPCFKFRPNYIVGTSRYKLVLLQIMRLSVGNIAILK